MKKIIACIIIIAGFITSANAQTQDRQNRVQRHEREQKRIHRMERRHRHRRHRHHRMVFELNSNKVPSKEV